MNAHLQSAGLFRERQLSADNGLMVINSLAKDLMHPDADIRKSAKDALQHAFNTRMVYDALAMYLKHTELWNIIEFAMEGMGPSSRKEVRLACRFFIGKMIDECRATILGEIETAFGAADAKMRGIYGRYPDVKPWGEAFAMRRREFTANVEGNESGVRRKGHLRLIA